MKEASVTPNYAEDIWRSLELHIFPSIGEMPISQIKATHAINTLRPIAAKGSLETVKHLSQRLNEIMTFAINTGLIDANPLTGIKAAFNKPIKKHMTTIRPEELPELMVAIHQASIKKVTRSLIEFQLHTMVRPSEAAGARWNEINLDNKKWVIPAERMKKRIALEIPLTPQVIAILEQMLTITGNREFVFPSDRNPLRHINEQTANMALKRMGYENRLVTHGMRALASTTLNEADNGFDKDVIEATLAHGDPDKVRAAYNRASYYERRIELMLCWSSHIENSATGSFSMGVTR